MKCGVCEGRKYVPELWDDVDAEWIKCDACSGQGWLWITETITEQEK